MRPYAMMAFALGTCLLLGGSVISLLGVRSTRGAGLVGSAFFLGVIALALWTHLLLLARIPVTLWSVLGGPILAAAGAAWKGDRSVFRVPWGKPGPGDLPILLAALFTVGVAFSWTRLGADGEAIYSLDARSISHYGTFWNPDFTDPARIHPASRRPLLWPCVYADLGLLIGGSGAGPLRLWLALLHIASLGLLWERARPSGLWLGVFAWTPAFFRQVQGVCTGFPDATLGVLFLLGADALGKKERGLAILAISAAVLLKQDAWAFPIALGLATLLVDRSRLRFVMATLAIPVLLAGAWAALARHLISGFDFLPGQFDLSNLARSPGRWPFALARLGSEMVRPKHWGLLWIVGLLGLLRNARRLTRGDGGWLSVLAFQGLAYLAVWATYPKEDLRAWMGVQDMRLLLHLLPMAWMWLGSALGEAEGPGSPRGLPEASGPKAPALEAGAGTGPLAATE